MNVLAISLTGAAVVRLMRVKAALSKQILW